MNKIYVLLGEFTFLEEAHDGEYKAIIHSIGEIKSFATADEATDYGEEVISGGKYEGYLVPQVYNGKIEMESTPHKHQLVYDKVNARVVTEDDSLNAFYTNDFETEDCFCKDSVVENVVKMFNEGKSWLDIDTYLLDEADCTQDAREVIGEGLYLVFKSMD